MNFLHYTKQQKEKLAAILTLNSHQTNPRHDLPVSDKGGWISDN